jgi:hypothetical protein
MAACTTSESRRSCSLSVLPEMALLRRCMRNRISSIMFIGLLALSSR